MMDDYDPAAYGRAVKGNYDALYPGVPGENEAAVKLMVSLADEAPDRSFLEFGIGTGRLAIGVLAEGVRVAGIDGSDAMVAQLRSKLGGGELPVTIGDYLEVKVPGRFGVVALVFNGIFDPRGLRAQLGIFKNAASHLVAGGYFVVESWVMSDHQRNGDWSVVPRYVGSDHVELQLARYDIETNQIERRLLHLRSDGSEFVAVRDTYASPTELDLMADVSGFERVSRYATWSRQPFTIASSWHITVYRFRGLEAAWS